MVITDGILEFLLATCIICGIWFYGQKEWGKFTVVLLGAFLTVIALGFRLLGVR